MDTRGLPVRSVAGRFCPPVTDMAVYQRGQKLTVWPPHPSVNGGRRTTPSADTARLWTAAASRWTERPRELRAAVLSMDSGSWPRGPAHGHGQRRPMAMAGVTGATDRNSGATRLAMAGHRVRGQRAMATEVLGHGRWTETAAADTGGLDRTRPARQGTCYDLHGEADRTTARFHVRSGRSACPPTSVGWPPKRCTTGG
jgi:hypothetical protein